MSEPSLPNRRLLVLLFVGEGTLLWLALLAVAVFASAPGERLAPPVLLARTLVVVAVVLLSLYYGEVYELHALRRRTDFFLRLGRSSLVALLLLPLAYSLAPPVRLAPRLLLLFVPVAVTIVFLWHASVCWAAGHEALVDNVLILGTGHSAQQVAAELVQREPLGYRVVGLVGTTDRLSKVVSERKASLVVVALDDRRRQADELVRCRMAGVRAEDAPTFYERLTGKLLVSDLRPSWPVSSPGLQRTPLLLARRVLEVVLAALLLVALAPLLGLLALLIRLDSPGPALFRQPRVGLGGVVFDLWKLRTMRADAEAATGPAWTSPDRDRRITRVGRVLRTLRLDEVPQLVNVLRGEMGFVGPRPERPHFVEQLRTVIPCYDERHNVPPGITGWAQVKFGYGSTVEDAERKLQFDLYYIKNMSPFLDLAIMVDTLKVVLIGRGAR